MGYKNSYIFPNLVHKDKPIQIDSNLLEAFLWYTTSKTSYIQRTTIFDNTLLDPYNSKTYSPSTDYFVLIYMLYYLKLDRLYYYSNNKECDAAIDSLDYSNKDKDIMFLFGNKSPLFDFFEKARNSLAHGTFNIIDDRLIMAGQYRAELSSVFNFYLQKKLLLNNKSNTFCFNKEPIDSIYLSSIKLLMKQIGNVDGDKLIYEDKEVILNYDFKFKKSNNTNQIEQLTKLSRKYKNNIVILVNEKSNIKIDNLYFNNSNTNIIPYNKMIEFFKISIVINGETKDK